MAGHHNVSVRLTTETKARLEAEAKRQRMITGENITMSDLLRRYAESLPQADEGVEKKSTPKK